MRISQIGICVLGLLVFALGSGCKKSESPEPPAAADNKPAASDEPMASIHWIGMKRLAADANAAGFLKIWRLPETERLKAQTLDKLALAPWRLSGANLTPVLTNYAALVRENPSASLLRPLLDDLVQAEWYLEMREAKGPSSQLALAIRLDPKQAATWETNLGSVLEGLAGRHLTPMQSPASRVWQIVVTNSAPGLRALLRHVELARASDWTVLGLGADNNAVFVDLLARVKRNQTPFAVPATNDWLQTAFDLRRLGAALSWNWNPPQDWPKITLAINGNGTDVLTRGQFSFPKPLLPLEPWNIPTNLIHEPVQSLTAVQGIKPWLSSSTFWQNLKAGAAPNQLFCWAQSGSPFFDYAAAPLADANRTITTLGPAIMNSFNPFLETNRMGKWERATHSDGVAWNRAPIISPFVQSTVFAEKRFLLAGLAPLAITNTPAPYGTLHDVLSGQNLIYFDREITGPRVEAWMFLSQLFRVILRRNQLAPEASAVAWLKVAGPLLSTSSTVVTKTSPTGLSLARSSTLGLTAIEIHFLADWLESPQFPLHLYTTVAKLPPLPPRRVTGR